MNITEYIILKVGARCIKAWLWAVLHLGLCMPCALQLKQSPLCLLTCWFFSFRPQRFFNWTTPGPGSWSKRTIQHLKVGYAKRRKKAAGMTSPTATSAVPTHIAHWAWAVESRPEQSNLWISFLPFPHQTRCPGCLLYMFNKEHHWHTHVRDLTTMSNQYTYTFRT